MASSEQPAERESEPAIDTAPTSAATPSLRSRLRDKLPELVLEAASVVFAVLLALAVDQWRDARAEQRHAERARSAVEHELRSNASELEQMIERNREAVEGLRRGLDHAQPGVELSFDYQLAELSSAAWESARLSGAASGLDLDWLIGASRLYEIQGLCVDGQRQLVDRLAGMGEAIGEGDAAVVLRGLLGRAESLLTLSEDLRRRYDEFFEESGSLGSAEPSP